MKPGRSAETMTCLPSSADRSLTDRLGLVRGVRAADQLDQRHHRHRAEEVHARRTARGARARPPRPAGGSRSSACSRRRSAASGATPSSSRHSARLTSTSSNTASMTRSASAHVVDVVGGSIRASVASRSPRSGGPWRPPGRGWRRCASRPASRAGELRLVQRRPTCRSPRGPGRCRGPSARRPRRRPVRSDAPWRRWYAAGRRRGDRRRAATAATSDRPRRAAGRRRCTDRADARRPRRCSASVAARVRRAARAAHARARRRSRRPGSRPGRAARRTTSRVRPAARCRSSAASSSGTPAPVAAVVIRTSGRFGRGRTCAIVGVGARGADATSIARSCAAVRWAPGLSPLFTTTRSATSSRPGLDRLDLVAHLGRLEDDRRVGRGRDLDLALPGPDGLDEDQVEAGRVQHGRGRGRGRGEPAGVPARRHRADEDAVVARRTPASGRGRRAARRR